MEKPLPGIFPKNKLSFARKPAIQLMHDFSTITVLFEKYFRNLDLFKATQPNGLYGPAISFVQNAGKRIRPALTLMACELFSGEISEDAYQAAAGIELFHNFTLVHDDIMDCSDVRRGKPTIHREFGLPAGVLVGDMLNIYAYKMISGIQPAYLYQVMALFNRTAIEVCEGQQLDIEYEGQVEITEYMYLKMIELKTSALLAAALATGAIVGGASDTHVDKIYALGLDLGLAFQLMDDYLDTFGLESQTGKASGGDIKANKNTLLTISCQFLANDTQTKTLDKLLKNSTEDKVDRMKALYRETGADKYTRDKIAWFTGRAQQTVNDLENAGLACQPLRQLVEQLLNRKY